MTAALRLKLSDLTNLTARVSNRASLNEMRDSPAERKKRDSKYGNTKVSDGGLQFDSKAEHKRWQYLALLEKAKQIKDLKMQVPFVLIPAQVAPDGSKIRPTVYLADFTYLDSKGELVVEDVKGVSPDIWKIKKKLMLMVHSIWVQEIRA